MEQKELIPHLFRSEFRKITAVLCKLLVLIILKLQKTWQVKLFYQPSKPGHLKGFPKIQQPGFIRLQKIKPEIILTAIRFLQKKLPAR